MKRKKKHLKYDYKFFFNFYLFDNKSNFYVQKKFLVNEKRKLEYLKRKF